MQKSELHKLWAFIMEDQTDDETTNCIGKLEHHIHKMFASVRVPGEDFVYHPTPELYAGLENYCNDSSGTGPPLLVIGESGLGKSALLSNWLERRFRNVQRLRTTEFVFWHAVGCSRQSTDVSNLIRRLIVDLKDRFELSRDVPVRKERLSWELPRFLDMASKKGKIIIVIDGVNRLMSDDNTEASLAWLPLELPANVRFVMSVTIPKSGSMFDEKPSTAAALPVPGERPPPPDHRIGNGTPVGGSSVGGSPTMHKSGQEASAASTSGSGGPGLASASSQAKEASRVTIVQGSAPSSRAGKKNRILAELERRPWQLLRVRPLDPNQCRGVILSFIQKTVQSEASSLTTSVTSFFVTSGPKSRQSEKGKQAAFDTIPGFILFECHIKSLQSHPCAGIPLFLRLFLRCAYLVCGKGFSLWHIWDDWLKADSVPALFERIMHSIEIGFTRNVDDANAAIERFQSEGGVPALRQLYPWHPALAPKIDEDTFAAIDFAVLAANERPLQGQVGSDITISTKSGAVHPGSLLQSLADQQWLGAADNADQKFEAARLKTERMVGDVVNSTKKHVRDSNSSLMDAVEDSVSRLDLDDNSLVHSDNELLSSLNNTSINNVAGNIDDIIAEDENEDDESGESEYAPDGDADLDPNQMEYSNEFEGEIMGNNEGAGAGMPAGGSNSDDSEHSGNVTARIKTVNSFHEEIVISAQYLEDSPTIEIESQDTSLQTAIAAALAATSTSISISIVPSAPTSIGKAPPIDTDRDSNSSRGGPNSIRGPNSSRNDRKRDSPGKRVANINNSKTPPAPQMGVTRGGSLSALLLRGDGSKRGLSRRWDSKKDIQYVVEDDDNTSNQPAYLIGGADVKGLDTLLGNALALLFVSRHGLQEHEMWALLASLSEEHYRVYDSSDASNANNIRQHEAQRAKDAWVNRNLILTLFAERGGLEDIWKTGDPLQSGFLSILALTKGLKKVRDDMGTRDMKTLLELMNLSGSPEPTGRLFPFDSSAFVVPGDCIENTRVNYIELIRRLIHAAGVAKRAEIKTKLTPKIFQDPDGLDNLEMFLLGGEAEERQRAHDEGGAHEDIDSWDNFSFNSCTSSVASTTRPNNGHGNSSTSKKFAKEAHLSLGPVVEESLLGVLCALGILHSPENQVLLLPVDSKVCRFIVRKRYVSRRGGEMVWHDHLIRHFQREANCMRRCEELPWHLQLCRKWYSLKDTLTDLKTFDLMFNSDLKHELMEYWIMLSEGPLYLTSDAARTAASIQSRTIATVNTRQSKQQLLKGDPVERQKLLTEMDSALALGLSDKEAKIHLMKDRIATFDVVEEFNRALENWLFRSHPNSNLIQKVVSQIASFMAQFSTLIEDNPSFLRLGIDLKSLQEFGLNFDDLKEFEGNLAASQLEDNSSDSAAASTAEQNQFPTPSQLAGKYYPYIRWVWVQFPWLCMKQASAVGRQVLEQKQSGYILPPSVTRTTGQIGTDNIGKDVEEDSFSASPAKFSVAMSPMKSPTERYWKTLKCDPTLPMIAVSPLRVQSSIHSTLKQTSTSLKILERTAHSIHKEDCRLFGGKAGHPSHVMLSASKYRRTMEEEAQVNKGIPFSEHCVRSVNQHTLFPTVEHATKERNAKVEETDMKLYQKASDIERRGGKMEIFEISLAEELKLLMEQERLEFINSLNANPFPLSEAQAEFQNEVHRLHKMRSLADRAVQMRRQRKTMLHDLKRQVHSRQQEDLVASASIVSGEQAIDASNNRLHVLSEALQEATEITLGYEKILDLVAHTPPYHDSHLAEIEGNLSLARQQLQDMIQCRKNIVIEGERASGIKSRQLEQKIEYYHQARRKLAKKRKAFLAKHGIVEPSVKLVHPRGRAAMSGRDKLLAKARSKKMTSPPARSQEPSRGDGSRSDSQSRSPSRRMNESTRNPKPGRESGMAAARSKRGTVAQRTDSLGTVNTDDSALSSRDDNKLPVVMPAVMQNLVGAFKKASEEVHLNEEAVAAITDSEEGDEDDEIDTENRELLAEVAMVNYKIQSLEAQRNDGERSPQSRGRMRLMAAISAVNAANNSKNQLQPTHHHHHHRRRKTKISFDRESLLAKPLDAFNKKLVIAETLNQSHETACRLQLEFIVEKTGSVNETEFLDRFYNSQKMKESLKAMQNLSDSKLAQLRAEHSELAGSLGKSRFQIQDPHANKMDIFVAANPGSPRKLSAVPTDAATDATKSGSNSASGAIGNVGASASNNAQQVAAAEDNPADHDARYFDHRLFASEMRLSSLQRLVDKTNMCINEVRTGTMHLMNLINVNSRLLHALPRSVPPPLHDADDIVKCLSWCEERLLGVNEAMMLDSTKPGLETDATKSLFERQTELASLVQRMTSMTRSDKKAAKRRQGKNAGDMSRVLIDPAEGGNFVSDIRSIVVPADGMVDAIYEKEMKKLNHHRNIHADEMELALATAGLGSTQGLSEFLSESLSTPDSLEALRRANALTRSVQGERAGFGFALESMLKSDLPSGVSPPKVGKLHSLQKEETPKDRAWKYWDQQIRTTAAESTATADGGDASGSPKKKNSSPAKLAPVNESGEPGTTAAAAAAAAAAVTTSGNGTTNAASSSSSSSSSNAGMKDAPLSPTANDKTEE